MSTCSVILITYNEERHITDCLHSVAWADEIIVVDAHSTDKTVSLAREFTDKIFLRTWEGYAAAKNFALSQACGDWVLWIDADERVPEDLAAEIGTVIQDQLSRDGYEMPRKAFFLGRWIKHCGWYPGYVLRLFQRSKARFSDHKVHEGVSMEGSRGRLVSALLHYTDEDLEHYFWKFNRYTSLAAEELALKGGKAGAAAILFHPFSAFIKMYILKKGFLDGIEGFMLCLLSANYVAAKYAKLWEYTRKK